MLTEIFRVKPGGYARATCPRIMFHKLLTYAAIALLPVGSASIEVIYTGFVTLRISYVSLYYYTILYRYVLTGLCYLYYISFW